MRSKKLIVLLLVFSIMMPCFGKNVQAKVKELSRNQSDISLESLVQKSEIKKSSDLSKVVDFKYDKECSGIYFSDYNEEVQINVGERLTLADLGLEVTSTRKKASKEVYFVYNKKAYEKDGYYLETVKVVNRVTKKSSSISIGVVVLKEGEEYKYLEALDSDSGDAKDRVVVRSKNIRPLSKTKIMYAQTAVLLRDVPNVSGLHYGKILDRVWYGHKVKVLGRGMAERGNSYEWWYKVSYKGKVGYVDEIYFSEKQPKIYKGKDISYSNGNPERIIKHKDGIDEVQFLGKLFWVTDNSENIDEGYYYY